MSEFTPREQYVRIVYLGIVFMFLSISFNSLSNIVAKIYDDYGLYNLGQAATMALYTAYGITTFFSSYIIRLLGFKKSMLFGSLGCTVFEVVGIVVAIEPDVPAIWIWVIVIGGSILCGIGSSVMWVSQSGYLSEVASENRKN